MKDGVLMIIHIYAKVSFIKSNDTKALILVWQASYKNDTLSYLWTQTTSTSVTSNNADKAIANFTTTKAIKDQALTFKVTVASNNLTAEATTTVTINNAEVIAQARHQGFTR